MSDPRESNGRDDTSKPADAQDLEERVTRESFETAKDTLHPLTKDLPDEMNPAAWTGKSRLIGAGCLTMVVITVAALIILLWLLSAAEEEASDRAAAAEDADLALISGPYRIRNEELTVAGQRIGGPIVERGTFTEAGSGRTLVGAPSREGDVGLTFALEASEPDERVYVGTFMGAIYRLTFDEPGHFVGEVTVDGVLERRLEGWSELLEDGSPRPGLPDVSPEGAGAPSLGSGDPSTITATCDVPWLPAGLSIPGAQLQAGQTSDGDPACVGRLLDGSGSLRNLLQVEAGRLGLDVREHTPTLISIGCASSDRAVVVAAQDSADGTQVVVTPDTNGCPLQDR